MVPVRGREVRREGVGYAGWQDGGTGRWKGGGERKRDWCRPASVQVSLVSFLRRSERVCPGRGGEEMRAHERLQQLKLTWRGCLVV